MQMEVTKSKNSYFLVWTMLGMVICNITVDKEVWESLKSNFELFYKDFYLNFFFQSKGIVQFNVLNYCLQCVRVCSCVRACVCVCVFILFHLLASSDCKTSVTYLRCSDQRSFVVSTARGFCQVPSSPYLKMSYFIPKDENASQHKTGEKTIWYIDGQLKDDIYWYRV